MSIDASHAWNQHLQPVEVYEGIEQGSVHIQKAPVLNDAFSGPNQALVLYLISKLVITSPYTSSPFVVNFFEVNSSDFKAFR